MAIGIFPIIIAIVSGVLICTQLTILISGVELFNNSGTKVQAVITYASVTEFVSTKATIDTLTSSSIVTDNLQANFANFSDMVVTNTTKLETIMGVDVLKSEFTQLDSSLTSVIVTLNNLNITVENVTNIDISMLRSNMDTIYEYLNLLNPEKTLNVTLDGLTVQNDTHLVGNLIVDGQTIMNGNVSVADTLYSNNLNTVNLRVYSSAGIDGSLGIGGGLGVYNGFTVSSGGSTLNGVTKLKTINPISATDDIVFDVNTNVYVQFTNLKQGGAQFVTHDTGGDPTANPDKIAAIFRQGGSPVSAFISSYYSTEHRPVVGAIANDLTTPSILWVNPSGKTMFGDVAFAYATHKMNVFGSAKFSSDTNGAIYFVSSYDSNLNWINIAVNRPNSDKMMISGVLDVGGEYRPIIGSHNSALTQWDTLWINQGGSVIIGDQPASFATSALPPFKLAVGGNQRIGGSLQVDGEDLGFEILGINVNGNVHVTGDLTVTGSYPTPSDERLKTNFAIPDSESILQKVMGLQPYNYTYNSDFLKMTNYEDTNYVTGFKAQDVYVLFPELVGKLNLTFQYGTYERTIQKTMNVTTNINGTESITEVTRNFTETVKNQTTNEYLTLRKDKMIAILWVAFQESQRNFQALKLEYDQYKANVTSQLTFLTDLVLQINSTRV